jgi:hypothetical protein
MPIIAAIARTYDILPFADILLCRPTSTRRMTLSILGRGQAHLRALQHGAPEGNAYGDQDAHDEQGGEEDDDGRKRAHRDHFDEPS